MEHHNYGQGMIVPLSLLIEFLFRVFRSLDSQPRYSDQHASLPPVERSRQLEYQSGAARSPLNKFLPSIRSIFDAYIQQNVKDFVHL